MEKTSLSWVWRGCRDVGSIEKRPLLLNGHQGSGLLLFSIVRFEIV